MKKIVFLALLILTVTNTFSQISSGDIPSNDRNNTPTTTNQNDQFSYYSISRLNIGFGNSNSPGVSTIGVGYIGDFSLTGKGRGNLEFELGTTSLVTTVDIEGFSDSASAYLISGALKYGYFATDNFKISSGVGYYFGITGTSGNDLFYSATMDYFFTKGFGLNVRYDELLGFNFGISLSI